MGEGLRDAYGNPVLDDYGTPVGTITDQILRARDQANVLRQGGDLVRQGTNALASMAVTNLAPDPYLPGALGYIPGAGIAEGTLGFGKFGWEAAQSLARRAGVNLPDTPDWIKTAVTHQQDTNEEIQKQIDAATGGVLPAPDPSTAVGAIADIVGSGLGGGLGLAPARIANAAPRGLKTITSLLFPSLEHAPKTMAISAGLGTTLGLADQVANNGVLSPFAPASITDIASSPDPVTPAPTTPAPAAPTAASSQQVPSITALAREPDSIADIARTATPAPGPTFAQQGMTDEPVWLSGLKVILPIAAIAAGGHFYRRGAELTAAARDARLNDPALAQRVQAYNDEVIARGPAGNSVSPPGGVVSPAPIPQGSLTRRMTVAAAHLAGNDAAKVQDAIALMSPDPATAERLSAFAGNMQDSQLQQNRTMAFLRTGLDVRTGIRIPKMGELLNDFADLTSQERITLGDGLRSLNEQDNRRNNSIKFRGKPAQITDIRHDFVGKNDEQLSALVQAMRSNPVLNDMATRYKQITDGLIKIGAHQNYGFFSPKELADLLRKHPNYVAEVDVNGQAMHPLGERNTSAFTGQAQATSHPITDLNEHIEQLYPQFERNLFNQELLANARAALQRNPNAAQFIQDVQAPTGAHTNYYPTVGVGETTGQARDPIVTVRTPNGPQHLRIDNPLYYHALVADSRSKAYVHMGILQRFRRIYTQGTTGAASILSTRAVPLRNAAYTASTLPVFAPEHYYGGLLDRAVQRNLGVTSNVARAGDMLVNPPLVAGTYVRGVSERRAGWAGDLLHPQNDNIINREMRALIGDTLTNKLSTATQNYYRGSFSEWKEQRGLAGAGSPMSLAAPGVLPGTQAGPFGDPYTRVRLQGARLAPRAYFSGQWMGAKPFMLNVMHAITEAAGHLSDAGHDFGLRINRDNPYYSPEGLTYETRNIVGNPARKSGNAGVRAAAEALPYANVSAQGFGRAARAVAERPVGAPLTAAMGLGSMALLSILTHMRSAQHLDFLQNQLSLQQREANVSLALNDDPTKPTMYPLAQELRSKYAYMLELVAKAVNIVAARHDKVSFQNLWEGLKDFFGSHITTSNALAIQHGAVDLFDFFNLPIPLGRIDWNQALQNGWESIPQAYQSITGGPTVAQLSQQDPGTSLDTKTGQLFLNLLANTFGAAAHVFDTTRAMGRYMSQGHPVLDSIGMGLKDWIQMSHESNLSMNNVLFETQMRLSKQPPIAETLQPQLYHLKQLPALPDPSKEGYTKGANGDALPIPKLYPSSITRDPYVLQMLQAAHNYSSAVNDAMKPINALKQQMSAVEQEYRDPVEKRQWLNNQTRIIADRWKLVQSYVDDLNNLMSRYAHKPIRFNDIDWTKGREQFNK